MTATSDTLYTYIELHDLTPEGVRRVLADKVVNVEPGTKWGYRCELCKYDSGPVFNRALADMMLKRHCKSPLHRKIARQTPTRLYPTR